MAISTKRVKKLIEKNSELNLSDAEVSFKVKTLALTTSGTLTQADAGITVLLDSAASPYIVTLPSTSSLQTGWNCSVITAGALAKHVYVAKNGGVSETTEFKGFVFNMTTTGDTPVAKATFFNPADHFIKIDGGKDSIGDRMDLTWNGTHFMVNAWCSGSTAITGSDTALA